MKRLLLLALLATPRTARSQGLDTLAMRAHTYFLAHDLLEGRDTGSRGAAIAARYLVSAAERLGLRPVSSTGWLQDIPLVLAVIDSSATTMQVTDGSGTSVIRSPDGFIPNGGTATTLADFEGPLAWVGTASDVLAHPTALPVLTGRVAIMSGVFGADLAAADTLRSHGVSGVLQVVGNDTVYELYRRSRGPDRMYLADASIRSSFVPAVPTAIIRGSLARRLLPPISSDDQLARPFLIEDRSVRVAIRTRAVAETSSNVAAVLPGADPARAGQFLVYSAHYDHLGLGEADERGDSIYNGFSDNAAGCAMLLAIAQAMRDHPPGPSVLFLFFTGEERGLLGSDYFVARPLVAPESILAVINLDAGAPPAPVVSWHITGGARSTLGQSAIDVAQGAGWAAQTRPPSPNTDYYPFLRIGVPAIFLVPSPAAYEGLSMDSTTALRRRWDRYHAAADNWHADFPFSGLLRYADFAMRIGLSVASGERPRMAR